MKTVVVTDIHGCLEQLEEVLKRADFRVLRVYEAKNETNGG